MDGRPAPLCDGVASDRGTQRAWDSVVVTAQLSVAGWSLERHLGTGAFGQVWEVEKPEVGLRRAMKFVAIASDRDFKLWLAELQALEELKHANIVRFYDAGPVGESGPFRGHGWILTELCERSLEAELTRRERSRIPVPECSILCSELLSALANAHNFMVHRDVKPQNVLLGFDGMWKLADFGAARLIPSGSSFPQTQFQGTLPYAAPWALRGRQDRAADLYALGVVLHRCLVGTVLHPAAPTADYFAFVRHVENTPPRLSPSLPPGWRNVIETLIGSYGPRPATEILAWFNATGGEEVVRRNTPAVRSDRSATERGHRGAPTEEDPSHAVTVPLDAVAETPPYRPVPGEDAKSPGGPGVLHGRDWSAAYAALVGVLVILSLWALAVLVR